MLDRVYLKRTVDAFVTFLKEQLTSPVKLAKSEYELNVALNEVIFVIIKWSYFFEKCKRLKTFKQKKRAIIGYFKDEESQTFKTFSKLASILKDNCNFYSGVG